MKPPGIGWIYLGKNIKYQKALNLQNYLVAMKKQSSSDLNPVFSTSGGPSNSATHLQIPDILLLLEHSPTYTSGRRGPLQSTNHTLEMQESDSRAIQEQLNKFQELGADYIQTPRGGLMTFHGPGQLVGYPILDLNHYKKDLTWYVCALENSIIQFLKESYQLNAHTTENVGVWMERQRKIAAIGFHCSRWITSHGFSLNLNVDLDWYSHFVPCGLTDKQVTSIYEELKFKNSKTKNDDNFITENFMQYELPSFLETISNNFLSVPMFSLDQVYPELSEEIRRLVK